MGHKCYISFKTEDESYKTKIQEMNDDNKVNMIDKSLNEAIDSDDDDYIMRKIREDYLSDSTVTIFFIGTRSNEYMGAYEQRFIKRELQASLYNGANNTRNGILGVVLPSMYESVFKGEYSCSTCGNPHHSISIGDSTAIKEFAANYYIKPLPSGKCGWSDEDRYCILVKWDDFKDNPNKYIKNAFDKRTESIASKVTVYPK